MTRIDASDNVFFQDPKRLDKLKGREGLEAAAGEFEAMFLQMVLKNMRAASSAVADEDSFLSSQQQKFYQSMADDQLAGMMAQRNSLGIAEALVKQLGDGFKKEPTSAASIDINVRMNNADSTSPAAELNTPAFQQPLNRPLDSEEQ